MRRRVVVAFVILGVLITLLAIALASVGTQVDKLRVNRSDLEMENGDLQEEVDTLTGERDTLKKERDTLQGQVAEQLKTIQQLKAQLERAQTPAAKPAANP